jgi:hypothetical protein
MVQVTIPEDYKRKLYSFQYLEQKVGKQKLYEFVRHSVETGNVDTRKALGLGPRTQPRKSPPILLFIIVGVVILAAIIWYAWRHDDGWAP